MARDDNMWFEPKRFGIGMGRPVAWQGWALLGGYLVVVGGLAVSLMPRHPAPYYLVAAAATLALFVVSARHTRGGWRWRWNETD